MISIFPLSTFHLHVATFQQHLYMEYISSLSVDQTLWFYHDLLVLANKEATELRVPSG